MAIFSQLHSISLKRDTAPNWLSNLRPENKRTDCIGPFHVHLIHGVDHITHILSILSRPSESKRSYPNQENHIHPSRNTHKLNHKVFFKKKIIIRTCKAWSKRPSSQSRDISEYLWNQIAVKNIWILVNTYLIYLISTTSHIYTFQVHRAPDNYY